MVSDPEGLTPTPMANRRSEKSTGPSQRQLRVGELIRHALSEMLTRGEIHDDVLAAHVVTVPEVRMSPDLRLATVYVMPLGGKDTDAVLEALERNRRYIRGEVARRRQPQVRARHPLPGGRDLRRGRTASSSSSPARRSAGTSRSQSHGTPQEGQGRARLAGAGQAGRHDVDAGRRRGAPPVRCAQGRPRRHARPAGDRRAADRVRRGDQDRALRRGRHQALPLHRALGRRAPTPTTPRARSWRRASCGPRARPSRRCCRSFTGEILQTPPAFSAIKVDGDARLRPGARGRGRGAGVASRAGSSS